jgi:hypothetical protein
VEIVGDWTSATLLTRLMLAIDSPWTVDKKGFVHSETGERCTAQMRGHDALLPQAFRDGDDPERPTLTDDTVDAIAGHKSVVRVRAGKDLTGLDALRALVSFGDGLVDAGATALWCPETGASRSAQAWKDIAETVEVGSKKERMRGLFTAFVRPLLRTDLAWRTRGMAFLGLPDVAVPASVAEPVALDAIRLVCDRLLESAAPARIKSKLGTRTVEGARGDDASSPTDVAHNPHGVWTLTLR